MLPSTAYTLMAANFGFTDLDAGDALNAVRIDALPAAGSLTLSGTAVTGGQVIAIADINAGNLVFTPVPLMSGVPYASFSFSVQDTAGAFDAAPNTITVNVAIPINTPPTGTNGNVTTQLGVDYVFTLADFGFNDADAGDTMSAVQIDSLPLPLFGTLYFGAGLVVPGTNYGAAGIAAGNLYFRPALLLVPARALTSASATLSARRSTPSPNTMVVTIAPATNDPVNAVPGPKVVNEDTVLAVAGLSVNDPNGDLDTVQLTVTNGTLTLGTTAGLTFVSGDGTADATMTFRGALGDINAALATVSVSGRIPNFSGASVLTMRSTDLATLFDVDIVAITVNPVNDAPLATAPRPGTPRSSSPRSR